MSRCCPAWSPLWPVSVNASGTEFRPGRRERAQPRPPYVLVDNDEVQAWDPEPSWLLPPAYVGDALARVTTTGDLTITYQVELGPGRPSSTPGPPSLWAPTCRCAPSPPGTTTGCWRWTTI